MRSDRTDMTNLIAPFAILRTRLKTKIWDVNVGYWWKLPQSVFQHLLSSRFCILNRHAKHTDSNSVARMTSNETSIVQTYWTAISNCMLEVWLTFHSFDVRKIHNSICNERSSTNMATDRNSFRTVELAFAVPALS